MRIQHNIMAMNAYRNYNTNTKALSGNLEKLSSGYKINRAGDDAAGLAISEKMRAQITGLDAAQKNVKDGISLVKTAEGAMQEIQDMLNRMDYLATQSANGTYQDDVDRENLQKEVNALIEEIDRIADSANFNGIQLLNGDLGGSTSTTVGSDKMTAGNQIPINAMKDASAAARKSQAGEYTVLLNDFEGKATAAGGTVTIKVAGKTIAKVSVAATGVSAASPQKITMSDIQSGIVTSAITIGGVSFSVSVDTDGIKLKMKNPPSAKFTSAMAVTMTGLKSSGSVGNQSYSAAVRVDKAAIEAQDTKYAMASFTLTSAMVQDGNQIRIGNQVYTFAVGKDSKYKDSADIDLTHLEANDTNLAKEASRLLSQAASDNKWFKVTSDNNSAKVYLTEKLIGDDRPYTNNMAGQSGTVDADWMATGTGKPTILAAWGKAGEIADTADSTKKSGGLKLQIGDTADTFNQLAVKIGDMHADSLGIGGLDISNQTNAAAAIKKIKNAINSVSSTRGDLGAVQNRLEHTGNNLAVMAENIQDAESTIRDTDVADEMMKYVKNNILVQSAQAMLAQANQVPQGVLQLLG